MYEVFISHAQEQIGLAKNLKGRLSTPNVKVFLADTDIPPGESLSDKISKKIKQSNLFVLLWTDEASDSNYVEKEIFVAKGENVDIIPIVLETDLPLPRRLLKNPSQTKYNV